MALCFVFSFIMVQTTTADTSLLSSNMTYTVANPNTACYSHVVLLDHHSWTIWKDLDSPGSWQDNYRIISTQSIVFCIAILDLLGCSTIPQRYLKRRYHDNKSFTDIWCPVTSAIVVFQQLPDSLSSGEKRC